MEMGEGSKRENLRVVSRTDSFSGSTVVVQAAAGEKWNETFLRENLHLILDHGSQSFCFWLWKFQIPAGKECCKNLIYQNKKNFNAENRCSLSWIFLFHQILLVPLSYVAFIECSEFSSCVSNCLAVKKKMDSLKNIVFSWSKAGEREGSNVLCCIYGWISLNQDLVIHKIPICISTPAGHVCTVLYQLAS